MFKKLKDKIAEDLKFSPQRIQQLTQSVTDKLQNSTNEDSFFSIADDDSTTSPTNMESGFSDISLHASTSNESRTRRYSNSSMASDISFLPRYEPPSNMYHVQSDLDISASEFEDNVSTSSQLGHISKEQVYAAFQKAQMRYHKYRGRYTDIANHYKNLEKENAKIKAVLVETQDKAIRRANELREQCNLEQRAKAHLENALRVDLDEKEMKIDSLQTQIKYLQQENAQPLVDLVSRPNENLEILTKHLNDARLEIENLNGRIQEMKANSIIFSTKEVDYKQKIHDLDKSLQERIAENLQMSGREKENNIKFAQGKMELHAEINNKDIEINNLKRDVDKYREELDKVEKSKASSTSTRIENLQSQNGKLIEKVESLNAKCANYESELVRLEQYKIEIANLNEIISNLKKMNEEIVQQKKHSDEILKEFDGIKEELSSKANEFNLLLNQNEEFQTQSMELSTKLNLVIEENKLLAQIKSDLERQVSTLKEKEIKLEELKQTMKEKELQFENEIREVRNDTRNSLITLESKIKDKFDTEYKEKEIKLREEFDKRVQSITSNETRDAEMKLMECEDLVKMMQAQNNDLILSLEQLNYKYNDLETNHLDLINENGDTRNSVVKLEKENSKLVKKIESMEKQLRILQNNEKELKESLNLNTKLNKQLDDELLDLKHSMENKEKYIGELKSKIESFSVVQDELSLLQNVSSEQQNKFCTLSEENKELKQNIESILQLVADNDPELLEMYKSSDTLILKLHKSIKVLKEKSSELLKVLKDFEGKNLNLKMEIEGFTLREKNFNEEIRSLQEITEKSEQKFLSLEEKFYEKENVLKNLESMIQENNETLQAAQEGLAAEKSSLNKEIDNLKVELENKLKVIAELTRNKIELEDTLKDEGDLHSKLQDVISQCDNLQRTVQEKEAHIEELERICSESSSANINLAKIMEEFKELEKRYQNISNDNKNFENTIQELKEYETKYQTVLDENHNFHEQIEDLRAKLEVLENVKYELELTKSEKDDLNKAFEKLEKQKRELLNEAKKSKQEILELKVLNEKLHSTDTENTKLVEDISSLQVQIRELLNENQNLKVEISKFQQIAQKYKSLQSEFENLNEKNIQLSYVIEELTQRNKQVSLDNKQIIHEHEKHITEFAEYKLKYDEVDTKLNNFNAIQTNYEAEINNLKTNLKDTLEKLQAIQNEKEELAHSQNCALETNETEALSLRSKIKQFENEKLDRDTLSKELKATKMEINNLTQVYEQISKDKKNLESQMHELERHYSEIIHEKQLLMDEIQELKISPLNLTHNKQNNDFDIDKNEEIYSRELESLREKLEQYKSIDKANRSSIEFYENELQKLKIKNEKLDRKLDETLVTLPVLAGNHNFSDSTAILEYLRNIIFNYMTGKESMVLAKVIAAVCKFDKEQTDLVLQKEQQKQTLLGQLFGS